MNIDWLLVEYWLNIKYCKLFIVWRMLIEYLLTICQIFIEYWIDWLNIDKWLLIDNQLDIYLIFIVY